MFTPDYFNFFKILFENSYILFVILLMLVIASLLIAIVMHKQNRLFLTSVFVGLFLSFLQIMITTFIIERMFEHYQENLWKSTTTIIADMFHTEIKDDLTDIIYMIDFSEYRKPHNYLDSHYEKNLSLGPNEVIYASNELLRIIKLDDYADHKLYKKGDDIISYQISVLTEFILKMESNLKDIERIIDLAQINIKSQSYSEIVKIRNDYKNLIGNTKLYIQFLGVSEITGQIIEYNLKFELKYKKDMYNSIISTIHNLVSILSKKVND